MKNKTVMIISHRRSGTHWTIDAVRNNFHSVAQNFLVMDRIYPWAVNPLSIEQFQQAINENPEETVLIKSHLPPNIEQLNLSKSLKKFILDLVASSKIIYVYRDGRDVLVSLYHYMKKYDLQIKEIDFSTFLRMQNQFDCFPSVQCYQNQLNRVEYWKFHVEEWLKKPNVISISYEMLDRDYQNTVSKLYEFIESKPTDSYFKEISLSVDRFSSKSRLLKVSNLLFKKITGKEISKSSAVLPYQGVVGSWRELFADEDMVYFNKIAGNLLQKLNYYD